jgi:hypothetical protein
MKGSFGLNRLVRKAQNLERKLEYDLVKTGATSIETYKNRCLGYIERLGMLTNVPMAEKKDAARKMYKVYFNLQDFEGAEQETDMEVSLESLLHQLDLAVVETHSANVRSGGGLGFSSVHGLMLAEGISPPQNPYWRTENEVKAGVGKEGSALIGLGFDRSLYREPQSVVQWREEMKEQKEEVLRATKMQ